MMRISIILALAAGIYSASASAQEACLQEVIGNLYTDLEAIDTQGEARLVEALDRLGAQENWSASDREKYTLSISDNPQVDAVESQRTDILGKMFGLAQRGESNCQAVRELRDQAMELEVQQWEAAVQQVEQRIWH